MSGVGRTAESRNRRDHTANDTKTSLSLSLSLDHPFVSLFVSLFVCLFVSCPCVSAGLDGHTWRWREVGAQESGEAGHSDRASFCSDTTKDASGTGGGRVGVAALLTWVCLFRPPFVGLCLGSLTSTTSPSNEGLALANKRQSVHGIRFLLPSPSLPTDKQWARDWFWRMKLESCVGFCRHYFVAL